MKLFVVLPRLDGGGMERMRLNLLREFATAGVDAFLVVGQMKGELIGLVPAGIQILEISPQGPAFFLPGLMRALRMHRPSHLLCAADDVNCLTIIANLLTGVRARIVVSNHNTFSEQLKITKGLNRLNKLILRQAMRWLYPRADGIVAVSAGVADDLALELRVPREAIQVIYNPVITSEFAANMEKLLTKKWPVTNEPVVLYVGRLTTEKRPDLLLNAFGKVLDRVPARLVMAGVGPRRTWIESRITERGWQNRVTLLGFVSNPLPLMREASVLVLPSDHEGLPNVLIEALGCGTPIVATDCPSGPAEILSGGRFGRLVPVGNVDALAGAILDCIEGRGVIAVGDLKDRAADFDSSRAARAYLEKLTGVAEDSW